MRTALVRPPRAATPAQVAAVAVTEPEGKGPPRRPRALHVLTAAALTLPGLMQSAPCAAEDENVAELQFGRFHEDSRELFGLKSKFAPIESDSLHTSAKFEITDRVKAVVGFRQGTWSG